MKELKQKRDRSDKVSRRKPKIIETRTQQTAKQFVQNQTQQIINDAPNVPKLSNEDREILSIENQQFVEAQAIKHETQLANEVRQLYCRITTLQRNQAMILAQTNGLLAGRSLNLGKCSRVSGSGRTLILQQCMTIPVKIEARLTQCGYQPFFQTPNANFTVGKDGWSLHPFQDCFGTTNV
jgi:hypothetical protein